MRTKPEGFHFLVQEEYLRQAISLVLHYPRKQMILMFAATARKSLLN